MKHASEILAKTMPIIVRDRTDRYKRNFDAIGDLTGNFLVDFWKEINRDLGKEFSNALPNRYLTHKTLCSTMSSTNTEWAEQELQFLTQVHGNDLVDKVIEEHVGDPLIFNENLMASCNSIHHAFHMTKYKQATGKRLSGNLVIEWGGGYGRYPSAMNKMNDGNKSFITYIIIDIPALSCLQYDYNSEIYGEDSVNLLKRPSDSIQEGKINLIPVGLVDKIRLDKPDLFIAMWSLGESAVASLEFVQSQGWLESNSIMMATHCNECGVLPMGQRLDGLNTTRPVIKIPCAHVPNHTYLFR